MSLKTTTRAAGGAEGSHPVESEGEASENEVVLGHQKPAMD